MPPTYELWRSKTPIDQGNGKPFSECETCHTTRDELVEVGFYWVCDQEECRKKAADQCQKDIDEFGEIRPNWEVPLDKSAEDGKVQP